MRSMPRSRSERVAVSEEFSGCVIPFGPEADITRRLIHVRFTPARRDVRFVPKAEFGHLIRSVHRRGRSRTSCWSNGVADVPRRYWNLIKLDFERTERIRDSICKRGGWADRATFADTLNAERIER